MKILRFDLPKQEEILNRKLAFALLDTLNWSSIETPPWITILVGAFARSNV